MTLPEQAGHAPVVVAIPVNPIAVAGTDARVHLAYELHVTNFEANTGGLLLERLEAFGDADRAPLVSYNRGDLERRVLHPGAEPKMRYGRSIEGGRQAVVHVWI